MTERCELTDMLTDQCAHCRKLPELDPPAFSHAFVAAYAGYCHYCGRDFAAGERIRRVHDDDGPGYLGPCHADDQEVTHG